MEEKKFYTEYRIVGRFVKDEKHHVVDRNPSWTLADAERRLEQIRESEVRAQARGYHNMGDGVTTPYYSEYQLVDLRIQAREVTPWHKIEKGV